MRKTYSCVKLTAYLMPSWGNPKAYSGADLKAYIDDTDMSATFF